MFIKKNVLLVILRKMRNFWKFLCRKVTRSDMCFKRSTLKKIYALQCFITELLTITRTWRQPKCPHIHNGMLVSHEKEQHCATCRAVDGPRGSIQMEVSQKEKNEHHTVTCVCEI